MKLEVMKRGVAAMLCCAVLTAGMPMGALAEGEAQTDAQSVVTDSVVTESVVTESVVTEAQPQITYEKFTLRCDLLEGSLCVSVNGGSALDVLVRVTDEKGESAGKQTVSKGNGTVFFNNLTPGVYTVSAAYTDAEAAKAVSAVSKTVEIIDAEAAQKAAEEEAARQKAAEEAARQKAAEEEAERLKAAAEEAEKLKAAAEEAQKQQSGTGTGDGAQQDNAGTDSSVQLAAPLQAATLALTPGTLTLMPGTLGVVEDDITDDDTTDDDTTETDPPKKTRDADPVEGKLTSSATVSGHTVTATFKGNLGQPIDCCLSNPVTLDPYDSSKGQFEKISDTATVKFEDVPAGTYVLAAWYSDNISGFAPDLDVTVKDTTDTEIPSAAQFTVEAKGGEDSVTVTVSGADERAVNVVLTRPDTTTDTRRIEKGNDTLVFSGLAAGTYGVTVVYQDTVTGAIPVTTSVEVTGKSGGGATVAKITASATIDEKDKSTIVVTVGGESGKSAEVKLSGKDALVSQGKVVTLGDTAVEVPFAGLAADTYTVTVDYTPHEDGIDAVTCDSLTVGSTEPAGKYTVGVETGKGTIDVTVSGALAQDVVVLLATPDDTEIRKTIVGGNGTASFTGLVKGTYGLYIDYMAAGTGVKAVEQEVDLTESADVIEIVAGRFEVDAAVGSDSIAVTVTKAFEQAVDVVLVKPDNTNDIRTLAAGNGTVTFDKLAAGTYNLIVAYKTEVADVSAVKRSYSVTGGSVAGTIVATAKAGVGRVDVTVSAASKLPVDVVLMQGGAACATKRIEAGIGAVAFEGLAAGTYNVSIDYAASTSAGGVPYVIGDLAVTASIAKIAIAKVTAGENRITVTGTAQPGSDITLTTEPQSSTVIVHSDDKGAFTAEITCSAGTYTAVHAQYGADTASRVSATGTFTVTTPTTAPTLTVDRIDPDTISVVAKTTPGVVVNLATGDYGQTVTADSRGILHFYLPHTYGYGAEITFTVFYGAGNSLSYKQTEKVTDARTYHLLRRGCEGREVYQLTTRLKELGYPIEVTKKYDDRVVAAVRLFQANNGLTVDGITGLLTHNLVYSVAAIGYSETTYPTLVRGDRGLSLIYTLQQRLKDLGYYTLRVDGIFGSGTQRAVRDFQANNGLSVTGRADDATQKLLYSTSAKPAGSGSTGSYTTLARSSRYSSAVVTLQRRLKALGYLSGAADGYFGSQTYRAVRSFQSVNGLSVTGIADPATQALLYSAAAKAASGTTPSADTGYRLLYWGCKGDAVRRLQQALLDAGYKQVRVADGIYGQWTYDAVCAFQKANGLAIDGIAGKNTQNKLYGTSY